MKLNEITPDMIQALKDNKEPFGMMDYESKKSALAIEKQNFEIKIEDSWHEGISGEFYPYHIYRLKPDYELPKEQQKESFLFIPCFWSMEDCIIESYRTDLTDYDFIGWTNDKKQVISNSAIMYLNSTSGLISFDNFCSKVVRAAFAVFMLKEGDES